MTEREVAEHAAALVALDWGTTALRAYLLGDDGAVLDSRASPAGIMKLPRGRLRRRRSTKPAAGGSQTIPALPVIAAGMVGSAQGWVEAPYVETPADASALVNGIVEVTAANGATVHIVPGVLQAGAMPNVMRGEETQIVGALAGDAALGHEPHGALIGLPGTHAKWAFVFEGRIERSIRS